MIDSLYLWLKAFHIIAFVSWMAGMLYLPRLFVYHAGVTPGSESDKLFQIMELKLLRYIMNPAMIVVFALGIWLMIISESHAYGWMHAKLTVVLIMACIHGYLAACRKRFMHGRNTHTAKFYKWLNEVPTVLLVVIILLAVLKPF